MRVWTHPIARTLLAGTLLGLVILGAGGRLVMAAITANAGGTPRFTLGGTLTVVMLYTLVGLFGISLSLFMTRRPRSTAA